VAWLVLLTVGGACAWLLYGVFDDRASAGVGLPAYSMYSDGPDGFAQAAALLEKLGWQPVAVTRPIQQTRLRGLLVIAQDGRPLTQLGRGPALSDADVEGLLDWVRQGNTLLLCGSGYTLLHARLGINIHDPQEGGSTVYKVPPAAVGGYTTRINQLALEQPATVSAARAVPLWWIGNRPGAVVLRQGAGRVLVLPDPSLLTHRGLLRDDNALFLYNVAALDALNNRVYFDEYHHGIRSGGGYWNYLRYHNQQGVVLHLVLVAAMASWSIGRRLGPAVPMPITRQADGVDYASSVARIYHKADARPLVAVIMARSFLDALAVSLRLRRNVPTHEMVTAWRQRHGDGAVRELGHLLDGAEDLLGGRAASSAQLLDMTQRFDAFLNDHVRPAVKNVDQR
jgi:hypothetical protein